MIGYENKQTLPAGWKFIDDSNGHVGAPNPRDPRRGAIIPMALAEAIGNCANGQSRKKEGFVKLRLFTE